MMGFFEVGDAAAKPAPQPHVAVKSGPPALKAIAGSRRFAGVRTGEGEAF